MLLRALGRLIPVFILGSTVLASPRTGMDDESLSNAINPGITINGGLSPSDPRYWQQSIQQIRKEYEGQDDQQPFVEECNFGGTVMHDGWCKSPMDREAQKEDEPQKEERKEQAERNQPAQPNSPSCINEVRSLMASCQGAHSRATTQCDGSQLDGSRRQAEARAQQLSNHQNVNAACREEAQFQSQFQSALQQFANSCQSSISQCVSACQNFQRKAQTCNHPDIQRLAQQAQPSYFACTQGELAQRPNLARQEAQAAQSRVASAQQCASNSAAGGPQGGNGGGPLAQKADSPSGGAFPTSEANVAGSLSDSTLNEAIPKGFTSSRNQRSQTTTGQSPSDLDQSPELGRIGDPPHGGVLYNSGNMSLASLPTRQPTADENAEDIDVKESALLSQNGTSSVAPGGGRRPMGLRPLPRSTKNGIPGEHLDSDALKNANVVQLPDMNQFRPSGMAGLVRCTNDASVMKYIKGRGLNLQCLLSPHRGIFDAVHERYESQMMQKRILEEI